MTDPILKIEGVSKRFTRKPGLVVRGLDRLSGRDSTQTVHAVNDVNLSVPRGEVLGIVGESGCGKSTLGRVVSGIYAPSEGTVTLEGQPVARDHRGNVDKLTTRVQMIHQDPFASLNPRMKVGEIIAEGPRIHGLIPAREVQERVRSLLEQVGLEGAMYNRYPHELSGGQNQRVGIARAMITRPKLIVCDEAVSALDVSIQAQIVKLLKDLQDEFGMSMLFISHDLSVVRAISNRIMVLYLGRVVETAPADELYAKPLHPYTEALFASVPTLGTGRANFHPIKGEIPSPINPPKGCAFHPRCPLAGPRCKTEVPRLVNPKDNRSVACHLHDGGTGAETGAAA